jgi:hypothetical protein
MHYRIFKIYRLAALALKHFVQLSNIELKQLRKQPQELGLLLDRVALVFDLLEQVLKRLRRCAKIIFD